MRSALIRRAIALVPTLFGVSVAVFLLRVLIPGGPAQAILGTNATPQAIRTINRELGLDRPLVSQYWSWISGTSRATSASPTPAASRSARSSPSASAPRSSW